MGAPEAQRGRAGAPGSQEALGVGHEVEGAHPGFLDSQSVLTARDW